MVVGWAHDGTSVRGGKGRGGEGKGGGGGSSSQWRAHLPREAIVCPLSNR